MKSKKNLFLFIAFAIVILITSCAPGSEASRSGEPAGFFTGIWHGWIAPISLIVGIFNNNIRVYETINSGWWYDFGFYIAVISGFGSISLLRKTKKKD